MIDIATGEPELHLRSAKTAWHSLSLTISAVWDGMTCGANAVAVLQYFIDCCEERKGSEGFASRMACVYVARHDDRLAEPRLSPAEWIESQEEQHV
jgi:hypothetical protein